MQGMDRVGLVLLVSVLCQEAAAMYLAECLAYHATANSEFRLASFRGRKYARNDTLTTCTLKRFL